MSFACFIEANSFLCKYFVHRLIPLRPTCQLYLPCARCSCFVVCSHIHHWGHANKAALPRAAVLIYLAASARMRIPGWLHRVRAPQGARNDDRDDEDVEAVIFRNLWKHHRLLPPHHKYKSYWDMIMFTFVIYNSLYIPIDIAFSVEKPVGQCVIDLIIDLLFISDMLVNLRTAYYNENNELVLEARAIWRRYVFSYWFIIDLLAVFPFDIAIQGRPCASDDGDDSFTTVIKLLKAFRLLRLMRFRKELDRLSGANALRTAVSLCVFLLIAHWLACVWWTVGLAEHKSHGDDVICDATRPCSWFRRVPPDSLQLSPDVDLGQQYISSLYWSLTTLMKTPAIGPDTISEKIIATISIMIGAVVYAYFLSIVQGNFASFNKASAQKRDKLTNMANFLNAKGVSGELYQTVIQFTEAQYNLTRNVVNSQVLQQLPSHLRGDVSYEMYMDARDLFNQCSVECTKALLMRLNTVVILPNQIVIAKGEICNTVYILLRGVFRVSVEPPTEKKNPTLASLESSTTTEKAASSPKDNRRSSRRGPNFRDIERPGSHVGFVEPIQRKYLGLFPVNVYATKKTLALTLSQSLMADALEGFQEDLIELTEVLYNSHKMLCDSLQVEPTENSPLAMREKKMQAKSDKASEKIVTGDMKSRVDDVETTVQANLKKIAVVNQHLQTLPQIHKMISDATSQNTLKTLIGQN